MYGKGIVMVWEENTLKIILRNAAELSAFSQIKIRRRSGNENFQINH